MLYKSVEQPAVAVASQRTPSSEASHSVRGDDRNQTILANLINEGTAWLGPVRINNRHGVRACITNYRTRKSDIDVVLDRFVRLGESQRSV